MRRFTGILAGATAAAVIAGTAGCAISDQAGGEEDQTITLWHHYTSSGQLAALEEQNKLFEEANPGWTVDAVQVPGDQQDQKSLAAAAAGNGPDIISNNIVVDFPTLVGGGVFKDITEEWNNYAEKDMFPESAVWKDDGKVYNLMSYTNLIGLYANEDILDEYGIEMPKTVEELEAALAVIEKDGKYEGLAESGDASVGGAWLFMPLLLSQGVNYCSFEGPLVEQEFKRVQNWAEQGWIPSATSTWDQADAWQKFMTGDFAFGINGNWNLADAEKNASFNYSTAQFPRNGGPSQVFPGGEGLAIGAHTEHPEMAWEYLEKAWLSEEASTINYTMSGQIPVRSDVASSSEIAEDEMVQPFIEAAQTSAQWPNNENTANMQLAIGKEISAVISGQKSAEQGAQSAIEEVNAAIEAGGGGCE